MASSLFAESLETQSNMVSGGSIAADGDRSDWDGIEPYEFDDDFAEFYPVDIDAIQVAHDASNIYLRITALEWDTEETWRVGTYIDTDQDPTTGYTGDFLPVGADYFLEDASAFSFTAASQAEWGWAESGELTRDQSDMLDVEIAIPRAAIGNPTDFDFMLYANNTCCDFQMPDDIYPNEPGGFWTYEVGEAVAILGDCNGDGQLDGEDLSCVASIDERDAVLSELNTLAGDLDGNGDVAFADFLVLSANFGSSDAGYSDGNIDLADGVAFADFLVLSSNFGKTAAAASVPEPASVSMFLLAILGAAFRKSRRTRA